MPKRIIVKIVLAVMTLVLLSLVLPACAETQAYPELPLQEMRIAAYTKAFAERFGLPAPAPGTEPSGGLQAIEFAIEKGPSWTPYYYCSFYLYVDSSLPIKYPEEGVAGEKEMLIKATHFFGRSQEMWLNWPKVDRLHFNARQGSYNRKGRLATKDYIPGKRGAISDLRYREFYRDILPDLSYIKLGFTSSSLMIDNVGRGADIWIQKQSITDYRSRINSDPNDFIKFSVPSVVLHKIGEWGHQAEVADSKILTIVRKNRRK